MKIIWAAVLALPYTFANASDSCALQAERHLRQFIDSDSYSQSGQWAGQTPEGNLIYNVRTNLYGGEAQYEVILTPSCAYLTHRLLWAE